MEQIAASNMLATEPSLVAVVDHLVSSVALDEETKSLEADLPSLLFQNAYKFKNTILIL